MVESFVILIYRRDPVQRQLTGTIEAIGQGTRRRFTTPEELWACLNARPARPRRRKRRAGQDDPPT